MKNLCKIFFLCYMQRTEKVQDRKTITYIIQMNAFENGFIAILIYNAFKTVQQSAKDKEDICRRADTRQRYLTQDFTLC